MGRAVWLMLLGYAINFSAFAQKNNISADTLNERTVLSKSLLTARDSLTSLMSALQKKTDNPSSDPVDRKRLVKAISDMKLTKNNLDHVIDQVSGTGTWNVNLQEKCKYVLRDARREVRKIREDVKDLVVTDL
jgi:hypothetical protein